MMRLFIAGGTPRGGALCMVVQTAIASEMPALRRMTGRAVSVDLATECIAPCRTLPEIGLTMPQMHCTSTHGMGDVECQDNGDENGSGGAHSLFSGSELP